MSWTVKIIEDETGEAVKTMTVSDARAADTLVRGIEIDLNHERFHVSTEVVAG